MPVNERFLKSVNDQTLGIGIELMSSSTTMILIIAIASINFISSSIIYDLINNYKTYLTPASGSL